MNTSLLATERIRDLSQAVPHYRESNDDRCFIRDLLTDLHHFCEHSGVDLYQILDDSHAVYMEEGSVTGENQV